jgi:2-polyprenyl-6-methoxyphenol hydroxylase-like FAD-dependent oxidoreductase
MPDQTVVVVGAGPVGLFTALILAQKGIKVTVIEASEGISRSPRACVYVF